MTASASASNDSGTARLPQARQAAADRELRDKLIAATGGNVIRGPGIDDVSPIRAAMEVYSGRADLVRDPVQNRQQALSAERARNIVA
jgi:hypothetical protein